MGARPHEPERPLGRFPDAERGQPDRRAKALFGLVEQLSVSTEVTALIDRYRGSLPVTAGTPVVSLGEGSTPLLRAPRLSERYGIELWLKWEGANPTGSYKDRGMTVAVSKAVEEGAAAVVCASTGNTAASAAAYAARAGVPAVVLVPEARVAWTGNLVLGTGVPFLIEGGAETYLRTIERFADALDVETIVPGHGPIVKPEVLGAYRRYLGDLVSAMAVSPPGESVESALSRFPLAPAYLPPGIDEPTRAFIEGLHVFNVWRVLEERRPGVAAGGAR